MQVPPRVRVSVAANKMRVKSINEIFEDMEANRKDSEEVSCGGIDRESFKSLGLSFDNSASLTDVACADFAENPEQD